MIKSAYGWLLVFAFLSCVLAPQMVQSQAQDPLLIYRQAGASPEQQSQIQALGDAFEKSAGPKVAQARQLLKKIQEYSLQPMPDEDAVFKTQDEINQLQMDMATSKLNLMLEIRRVLTPEQRIRLVKLMKERRDASQHMQQMSP